MARFKGDLVAQILIILLTTFAPELVRDVLKFDPQLTRLAVAAFLEMLYVSLARPRVDAWIEYPRTGGSDELLLVADSPSRAFQDAKIIIRIRSRSALGNKILSMLAGHSIDNMSFRLEWAPSDFVKAIPQERGAGLRPVAGGLRFNPLPSRVIREKEAEFDYPIRIAIGTPGEKTGGELILGIEATRISARLLVLMCRKRLSSCPVRIIYQP